MQINDNVEYSRFIHISDVLISIVYFFFHEACIARVSFVYDKNTQKFLCLKKKDDKVLKHEIPSVLNTSSRHVTTTFYKHWLTFRSTIKMKNIFTVIPVVAY